jgi:hypothetical protein
MISQKHVYSAMVDSCYMQSASEWQLSIQECEFDFLVLGSLRYRPETHFQRESGRDFLALQRTTQNPIDIHEYPIRSEHVLPISVRVSAHDSTGVLKPIFDFRVKNHTIIGSIYSGWDRFL